MVTTTPERGENKGGQLVKQYMSKELKQEISNDVYEEMMTMSMNPEDLHIMIESMGNGDIDEYYDSLISSTINPSILAFPVEANEGTIGGIGQFTDIDNHTGDINRGYEVESDFPEHPAGEGIQIPDTDYKLHDNGVVTNRFGNVLTPIQRHRQEDKADVLNGAHERRYSPYQIQYRVGEKAVTKRIGELMLNLYGNLYRQSDEWTILYDDGNFANCHITNLRWVRKDNLKYWLRAKQVERPRGNEGFNV